MSSSGEAGTPEGIDRSARVRQAEALEELADQIEEQNRILEERLLESEQRKNQTLERLVDVLAYGGSGGIR